MRNAISNLRQAIEDRLATDMKAIFSKQDSLTRQLEITQQRSIIEHDELMKTLDAFRAEMRSEFATLKATHCSQRLRTHPDDKVKHFFI